MKIAYLITASGNPLQLRNLVATLQKDDCSIYIHVDKTKNIEEFSKLINMFSNVKFCTIRYNTYWGGYSQTLSKLELLKESYYDKYFDKFIFLSESDYPIKSHKRINEKLESLNNHQILICYNISNGLDTEKIRVKDYFYYDIPIKNHKVKKVVRNITRYGSRLFRRKKSLHWTSSKGKREDYYYACDFMALPHNAAQYILYQYPSEKNLIRSLKTSFCSCELFIPTLLMANKYYRNMITVSDSPQLLDVSNIHYFDNLTLPKLRILYEDDYDFLINSKYIFARKFDDTQSKQLMNKLDAYFVEDEKEEKNE